MSINNTANASKNSKNSNQKAISRNQLSRYVANYNNSNAPARVFMMDGGITPAERDGFIYLDRTHFKVRWHSGGDEPYILKPNDIIGIVERNKLGYEPKRLDLNSKEK